MRRFALTVIPALLFATACGSHSPVSPGASAAGPAGGATIKGSVVGPEAGASVQSMRIASGPAAAGNGLTVSVVGTAISAAVTSGSQFTLEDVPPGPVMLRFTGGGGGARDVSLEDVDEAETVEVEVSLDDSTATITSQRRSGSGGVELEGRIESLPPTTAADAFVVAGQTVTTDSTTLFLLRGGSSSFADLQLGVRVHVKGTLTGGVLAASVVNIQNTNGTLPVNVNGLIAGFTGTADDFEFTIDGRLIKGSATTTFFGNSSFANLADGKRAEVKGLQADGYIEAQRIHVEETLEKVELEGVIGSISGSGLDLTFLVDSTTVHTTASTIVQRKGSKQDAAVLQAGMTVSVTGYLQPDLSLIATKIQVKGDAVGGVVALDGSIGGLTGTCPTLSFSVKGYAVKTDAATVFTPSCASLKPGNKVTVSGTVQPDGSVLASDVTK